MHKTRDGVIIKNRIWEYLYDFITEKPVNEAYVFTTFGKTMNNLSFDEFSQLFNYAVSKDMPEAFEL